MSGWHCRSVAQLANERKLRPALCRRQPWQCRKSSGDTANCLHPRAVTTKLLDTSWGWTGIALAQGAALPVYLASSPDVERVTGQYFERTTPDRASPQAYDVRLRRKFWEVSAQLVGLAEPVDG